MGGPPHSRRRHCSHEALQRRGAWRCSSRHGGGPAALSTFIRGAEKKGNSRPEAERVFREISTFAAYGFCKAHAVAFSHITWQSAWLKAHHPAAFYAGLLILPPHVNMSGLEYQLEPCKDSLGIRCSLLVVRQIGASRARAIVSERKNGGLFQNQEDFFQGLGFQGRQERCCFFPALWMD